MVAISPTLEERISTFTDAVEALKPQYNMSLMTKVHVVSQHLLEYTQISGKPLIKTSEQVVESSHASLRDFLNNYVQRDFTAQSYKDNLLRGISKFNTDHI